MTAKQAGNFMRAFGDGTRLRIVCALLVRPTTVNDLTRLLRAPVQRVSRHLRYLHARGVGRRHVVRELLGILRLGVAVVAE